MAEVSQMINEGKLMSVVVLAEHVDGTMYMNYTSCENLFQMVGYLLYFITKRFQNVVRINNQTGEEER